MSPAQPPEPVRRPFPIRLSIALGATAVIGAVLWLFFEVLLVGAVWPPLESPPRQGEAVLAASIETGLPVHAPAARARAVREPQNAWSCLAFIFVAALLIQGARDALARWFAVTVAIAGLCAMLYHASATREFRTADVAGLYWGSGLVIVVAAARLGVLPSSATRGMPALFIWFGTGVLAVLATAARNVYLGNFKPLQVPLVTAVVAIALGSMLLIYCLRSSDTRKWQFGLGAMAVVALGFGFEMGDYPGGAWYMPGAIIQPHAVWHLLCAIGVALGMECFERPNATFAGRVIG